MSLKIISNKNVVAVPRRIRTDIQDLLDIYNRTSPKPYQLSASIGYAGFTERSGIIGCMKEANDKMYAVKSTKKNTRTGMSDKK